MIRTTVANFAGRLLYPLLALALVPFYLRHVGIECYGLIGLIAMFVSVLGVFSKGLGSPCNVRLAGGSERPQAGIRCQRWVRHLRDRLLGPRSSAAASKYEDARLQITVRSPRLQILDFALPPDRPVLPRIPRNVAAASMLAFTLTVIAVLLFDSSRQRRS